MSSKPYVIDEMISAKAIAARVEALAREISEYYADTDKLVVVGLLMLTGVWETMNRWVQTELVSGFEVSL